MPIQQRRTRRVSTQVRAQAKTPNSTKPKISGLVSKFKKANSARKRTKNLHPNNPAAQGKAVINSLRDKGPRRVTKRHRP